MELIRSKKKRENSRETNLNKMKKNKNRKRKPSRKTSIVKCVHCNEDEKTERSDTKYCIKKSCKKRESLFRIGRGYINEIKVELKNGLTEFYNDRPRQLHENPFKKEIKEFLRTKKTEEMLHPWKHEFDGFILYFFPHLKRKNYDIFYNEKRKKAWDHYLSARNILEGEKKEFKNFDRIS